MKIIKANTYIPISGEPFEMPLPLKLELLWANNLLCVYSIAEDETVDYTYNINTDIPILTPVTRQLKISDIYYLLRSRVFRGSPYVAPSELERFGLSEYNPYRIVRKTYGILSGDCYWLRRSGDKTDYASACEQYRDYYVLSPEQRAEKYKFKNTDDAVSYTQIEDFLDLKENGLSQEADQ